MSLHSTLWLTLTCYVNFPVDTTWLYVRIFLFIGASYVGILVYSATYLLCPDLEVDGAQRHSLFRIPRGSGRSSLGAESRLQPGSRPGRCLPPPLIFLSLRWNQFDGTKPC